MFLYNIGMSGIFLENHGAAFRDVVSFIGSEDEELSTFCCESSESQSDRVLSSSAETSGENVSCTGDWMAEGPSSTIESGLL